MNKTIAILVVLICITSGIRAQDIECNFCHPQRRSKTEANFNATYINHRHIVTLDKGNKMVVEMFNIKDYDVLQNTAEVLKSCREALAPFKDSLETSPSGNVRIDYVYSTHAGYKKIRIRKHDADGNMFISKNGEISHLKVEQDTIRILIQKAATAIYKNDTFRNYRPIQLTLVLNNYTDLDALIENGREIQHIIDTMKTVATPKYKVNPYTYKTTINFHTSANARERYSGKFRFIFYDGILTDEYSNLVWKSKWVIPETFAFVPDIGAGLLGGKATTVADVALEYRFRTSRGSDYVKMTKLVASSYFTFDKNPAGNIRVLANLFVNAEVGSLAKQKDTEFLFKKSSAGIGYMVYSNSTYLPGTTMKLYLNFGLKDQFLIVPEVIFTNNFKTVFPAFTIRGFLNRE